MSGGWNPTVHLSSQSGARPAWSEALATFVPGAPCQAERSAGAARGVFDLAGCIADGARAGADAAAAAGFRARPPQPPPAADEPPEAPLQPLWWVRGGAGKAFVDFQNDVTAADLGLAAREGYVAAEHAKRYTTLGMATDQGKTANVNGLAILAEARGDADPRGRHHDLPAAIHAGRDRQLRRPRARPALSADPAHRDPRLARAPRRRVRRGGALAAAAVLPGGRRGRRRGDRARGARGPALGGLMRRLDARQDRPAGARCGRLSRSPLRQRLLRPRRRPGALRADAARGRHRVRRRHHLAARRAPFPHDHHDRQCGRGAGAHGVLRPDRVAGARRALLLGHRAVGRHRALGTAGARGAGAGGRRSRCEQRGAAVHGRGRDHDPGRPVAHLPDQLLRRARVRGQRAGRLWRGGLGAADGRRRRVRHRPLRHGGARRAAHREGPRRRPGAGWPHHRPRSRSRPHAQHAKSLHRPDADGAARPGRSAAAGSGRAADRSRAERACAAAPIWSRTRSARAARPASAT